MGKRADLRALKSSLGYWRGQWRIELRWLQATSEVIAGIHQQIETVLEENRMANLSPMKHPGVLRLVEALKDAEADQYLIERASIGHYHHPYTSLAFPQVQLMMDLREAGLDNLCKRAINDEFDLTEEELLSQLGNGDKNRGTKK